MQTLRGEVKAVLVERLEESLVIVERSLLGVLVSWAPSVSLDLKHKTSLYRRLC